MRRILLRRPKFWRSENMAKFRENRRISYVMKRSCKVNTKGMVACCHMEETNTGELDAIPRVVVSNEAHHERLFPTQDNKL